MILITAIFLVLLLIGMPLGFAIGIAGFTFFLTDPNFPVSISSQRIISSTQSFPLLAVPLFVLAGHLMNATGITRRLLAFASALTGWIAGGLAHTSIVLSALMGGISGSSVADASMEARIRSWNPGRAKRDAALRSRSGSNLQSSSDLMAAAKASPVDSVTSSPVAPCVTVSHAPPRASAMTGRPHACASTGAMPKSSSPVSRNALAPR